MRKTVFFIFLALCLSLSAHSQSSEKNQKIKRLFTIMQTDKMIDQSFDQIVAAQKANIKSLDKEKTEKIEKMMAHSKELAKLMVNDLAGVYAQHYTEEDIEVLIRFYETPTGKKTIELQPLLVGEMMKLMQTKYMPMMMENLKELTH